jgi:uncharacterized protein
MGMERALIWTGEGEDKDGDFHVEFSTVELGESGLRATGTQLGAVPIPYRLHYRLDATGEGFVTRSLHVEATGAGWQRRLRLERDDDGEWAAEVGGEGSPQLAHGAEEFPAPGGDADALDGALDCDLGLSPLTNAMPVHRHSLHVESGEVDFLMAWVSVPDLAVHASHQRYTHLRRDADGAVIRYESLEDGEVGFRSDLEFAADGLVRVYPQLARRVEAANS